MEFLDYYDKDGNYLGKEDRNIVHRDALWHKTVHCWLYDEKGNVYFQIRKDEGTLYTTASGHVLAGETVKEGFGREISEEIGINIDYEKAELVNIVNFVLDKEKSDGTMFRDRAFANVYVCLFKDSDDSFNYDEEELSGLVKVDAKETLALLTKEEGKINGVVITKTENGNTVLEKEIDFKDFLVNKGETALGKYGEVLNKVIELTSEK